MMATNRIKDRFSKNGAPPRSAKAKGADTSFAMIDIKLLIPSPTNPRKHFDHESLKELAQTITKFGVIEPVILRAHPQRPGKYEIICGERRFRASRLAGQTQIRALIGTHSDDDVCEMQMIENDCRKDVTPLERARGYQQNLDRGKTIAYIADKTGRSTSSIRAAIRLLRMPANLTEAVEQELVPASTAEIVCRLPNEKMRARAARCVLEAVDNPAHLSPRPRSTASTEPLSVRQTLKLVEDHFLIELKGAPFDTGDARLDPEAGCCEKCPKRTFNDRETFPTGRGDLCTDPDCYRTKCDLFTAASEAEAKKRGLKVLPEAIRSKLFPRAGSTGYHPDWIVLDEMCWEGIVAGKTWKTALGDRIADVSIYFAMDRNFKARHVAEHKEAIKQLEWAGLIEHKPMNKVGTSNGDRDLVDMSVVERLFEDARPKIVKAIAGAGSAFKSIDPRLGIAGSTARRTIEALAFNAIDALDREYRHDDLSALIDTRVKAIDKADDGTSGRGQAKSAGYMALIRWIKKASPADLLAMLVEISLFDCANRDPNEASSIALLEVAGLDFKKERSRVMKELREEEGGF
jgi:ParB/RepB/Spo0J family partition protein